MRDRRTFRRSSNFERVKEYERYIFCNIFNRLKWIEIIDSNWLKYSDSIIIINLMIGKDSIIIINLMIGKDSIIIINLMIRQEWLDLFHMNWYHQPDNQK
uniref:Uncharacterized protein n=1 Tax=Onchocerca volvulus TaxID=6282 RepID=A0A8R1Y2L5_ONCVO